MFNTSLCVGIVFGPQANKLVQVVWPENWPISRQVVEVVHDNSDKKIDDLFSARYVVLTWNSGLLIFGDFNSKVKLTRNLWVRCTYKKRTKHVERYEVGKCNIRSAAVRISGFVAVKVTFYYAWIRWTSHHDFLPCLACSKHLIDYSLLTIRCAYENFFNILQYLIFNCQI